MEYLDADADARQRSLLADHDQAHLHVLVRLRHQPDRRDFLHPDVCQAYADYAYLWCTVS
jgi:hypothetical protein